MSRIIAIPARQMGHPSFSTSRAQVRQVMRWPHGTYLSERERPRTILHKVLAGRSDARRTCIARAPQVRRRRPPAGNSTRSSSSCPPRSRCQQTEPSSRAPCSPPRGAYPLRSERNPSCHRLVAAIQLEGGRFFYGFTAARAPVTVSRERGMTKKTVLPNPHSQGASPVLRRRTPPYGHPL